ncbi:MAG TPA: glycosyltransferase family 2 protein [Williamwhitmania sp.]|nr:glycosyltransferase family 2 protein [Williamwhitmania sp.]
MDISIVIPLLNEEESLPELHAWIQRVMREHGFSYEVIFIDDGSKDASWKVIEQLAHTDENVKGIKFRRNYGKSPALHVGFEAARGEVVITMDADLQDSPDEIPELYKMVTEGGYDLVSGWKKKRHDPVLSKNLPSKLFNATARRVSKIKLHDFNCGLKAYKLEVVKAIEVYGEMHRYIPIIAKQAGFSKIGEKAVQHQERKYGKTKFGLERFINGFLDLLTITFISKFGKRPMHLFGTLGTLVFLIGGGITVWLLSQKIYGIAHHLKVREVTAQPLFYLALVMTIIGVQLFVAGFIGELVSRNSTERNNYLVDKRI